ncbi:MAG TPA: TrmH family RNA methyltransferase [Anaerolineae bacterium]|nr:TrmH family RNA methyltransferase [Anaerolineae bacterium]
MSEPWYQMRQCVVAACRFRFPVQLAAHTPTGDVCPRCGGETEVGSEPYGHEAVPRVAAGGRPVGLLLDNFRSMHNVGAALRTADGAGVTAVYLCGTTPTPDQPKLAKTALGAEKSVVWEYAANGVDCAQRLKGEGYLLWGLETRGTAQSLFAAPVTEPPNRAVILVAGSEKAGVDPGILGLCDAILYLPMMGIKDSLNVSVALGIAVYQLRYGGQG